MQLQDGSKIVPYLPFELSGHGTHFTLSEVKAGLKFKELTDNELKGKPLLSTCFNEEVQRITVEATSRCALLRENLMRNLSDK